MSNQTLQTLADVVLVIHAVFVLAVVGGLLSIWLGAWRHWQWIRHWNLRVVHVAAIVFVAASTLIGWACPLTVL
jgi:fructose-specific phosphotransferase system IIC component